MAKEISGKGQSEFQNRTRKPAMAAEDHAEISVDSECRKSGNFS